MGDGGPTTDSDLTFEWLPAGTAHPDDHVVTANVGGERVGYLRWGAYPQSKYRVTNTFVLPEHRRRGVATALWEQANAMASAHGLRPPRHSPERTDAGDAFARSVDPGVPRRSRRVSDEEWAG